VAFAIGLFGFSTFQLLLRASYATQDARTPALVNLVAVALHLAVNLVFFSVLELGVPGLALGHAVAYVFASVVMLVVMRRRLGGIDGRRIVASLWRVLAAGLLTAATAWVVAEGFERWLGTASLGAQAAQVCSAVAAGLLVFVASAAALRIEEVDMVRRQMSARWRR
jgi:putative peptidoglycan lipid II flippase